jgi:outer membrane protein TolC
MRNIRIVCLAAVATIPAASLHAQTLTLSDAMTRARTATPAARVIEASTAAAAERVRRARAGHLPRVEVVETIQRGNQPVFVFSSLLAQQRFTAANFDVDQLNRPDPHTLVRTAIAAEHQLYDGGSTRMAMRSASLEQDLSVARGDAAAQELALAAARAFVDVLRLEAAARASEAAVAAAESDLARARARREMGLATDADALAVEVHLAEMQQRRIADRAELTVARSRLNEAIGAPLDQAHVIQSPGPPPAPEDVDVLVRAARASRPERRSAEIGMRMAETAVGAARSAFLPRVMAQGGWELNGSRLTDRQSAWLAGVQVSLNLFNGFADSARLAEARHAERGAAAAREEIDRRIEVEVRQALAHLEAARAREAVGRASLARAQESQRIVRDRYESGLATMADVLRAAEAAIDAEARRIAAEMDVVLYTLALDRAVGRL